MQIPKSPITKDNALEILRQGTDNLTRNIEYLVGSPMENKDMRSKQLYDMAISINRGVSVIYSGTNNDNLSNEIVSEAGVLDENQQSILLSSLNQVSKAWKSFAETVATIFAVNNQPVATPT